VRLTQEELDGHGLDLRTFTHELQAAGRANPPPKFALKGPIQLSARFRPRGSNPAETKSHSFLGGEVFTLGGIMSEERAQDGATEIKALMSAASASLAAAGVTSVTLPLDFAMEHFDGLETLVLNCTANSMRSKELPVPAAVLPALTSVPTAAQEARRGSW
jgi:hypothetical protein